MFAALQGPPQINELQSFTNELTQAIQCLHQQSEAVLFQSRTVFKIIAKEAPAFREHFIQISETYIKLADIYKTSAAQLERALEDFKDINCRYIVGKRLEKRRSHYKYLFKEAETNSEKALDRFQKLGNDYEAEYNKANCRKQKLARSLYNADKELIEFYEKFNKFKMRRVKSGWIRYSEAFGYLNALEGSLYNELLRLYKSISSHSTEPGRILSKYNPPTIVENVVHEEEQHEPDIVIELPTQEVPSNVIELPMAQSYDCTYSDDT